MVYNLYLGEQRTNNDLSLCCDDLDIVYTTTYNDNIVINQTVVSGLTIPVVNFFKVFSSSDPYFPYGRGYYVFAINSSNIIVSILPCGIEQMPIENFTVLDINHVLRKYNGDIPDKNELNNIKKIFNHEGVIPSGLDPNYCPGINVFDRYYNNFRFNFHNKEPQIRKYEMGHWRNYKNQLILFTENNQRNRGYIYNFNNNELNLTKFSFYSNVKDIRIEENTDPYDREKIYTNKVALSHNYLWLATDSKISDTWQYIGDSSGDKFWVKNRSFIYRYDLSMSNFNNINENEEFGILHDYNGGFDSGNGFNSDGFNGDVYTIETQSDGMVLIGGNFTECQTLSYNKIVRLTSFGKIDENFNIGTGFNATVWDIKIQNDGKILVGGSFSTYKSDTIYKLIRLNSDGSIDNTFTSPFGTSSFVKKIYIDGDKILVGGTFSISGNSGIIRLNNDGSVDNTFNGDFSSLSVIYDILKVMEMDFGIETYIIGGDFISYGGVSVSNIVLINMNGSINTSFNGGFNDIVRTISKINSYDVTPTDIIVGGDFTQYTRNSTDYAQWRISKINTYGILDTNFSDNAKFNGSVRIIKPFTDWGIFVGGDFTEFDDFGQGVGGIPARKIARLNNYGVLDLSFYFLRFKYNRGLRDGDVYTAHIDSNEIYIGGSFTNVFGYTKNRFFKMSNKSSNLKYRLDVGDFPEHQSVEDGHVTYGFNSIPNKYIGDYFNRGNYYHRPVNERFNYFVTSFNGESMCAINDNTLAISGGKLLEIEGLQLESSDFSNVLAFYSVFNRTNNDSDPNYFIEIFNITIQKPIPLDNPDNLDITSMVYDLDTNKIFMILRYDISEYYLSIYDLETGIESRTQTNDNVRNLFVRDKKLYLTIQNILYQVNKTTLSLTNIKTIPNDNLSLLYHATSTLGINYTNVSEYLYGYLYNGRAVESIRGLSPAGWSIPNNPAYLELFDTYLGYVFTSGVYSSYNTSDLSNRIKSKRAMYSKFGSDYMVNENTPPFWFSNLLSFDEGVSNSNQYELNILAGGFIWNNSFNFSDKEENNFTTDRGELSSYRYSMYWSYNSNLDDKFQCLTNRFSSNTTRITKYLHVKDDDNQSISVQNLTANNAMSVKCFTNEFIYNSNFGSGSFNNDYPIDGSTGITYDIDGNSYPTKRFGNQVWMLENLKTTKYRDGVEIPLAKYEDEHKSYAGIINDRLWHYGTLDIGSKIEGGILYYVKWKLENNTWGQAKEPEIDYMLIAAENNLGTFEWGCAGTFISTNVDNGFNNTTNIVAGCSATNIAAKVCNDANISGYTDWHLPSYNELEKLKNIINDGNYWSSSQYSLDESYYYNFSSKEHSIQNKIGENYVRPIRKITGNLYRWQDLEIGARVHPGNIEGLV